MTTDFGTRGFGNALKHPKATYLLAQPGTTMRVRPLALPASGAQHYLQIKEQRLVNRLLAGGRHLLNDPKQFITLSASKWRARSKSFLGTGLNILARWKRVRF